MIMIELLHISARLSCYLECPPLSETFQITQYKGIGYPSARIINDKLKLMRPLSYYDHFYLYRTIEHFVMCRTCDEVLWLLSEWKSICP